MTLLKFGDVGGETEKSPTHVTRVTQPQAASRTYGQPAGFTAHPRSKVGDDGHAGTLRIDSKARSAKRCSELDTRKVGDSGNERLRIHPARDRSYRVSYAGTDAREGSTSNPLRIRVRSLLHAVIAYATAPRATRS